ncbi:MAG: thioesterase family protein [Sphaerochaetaceae bacterium]|nr:thioesterase family protein [Spirochaetales bacterium]MDY5499105.1 thioesterase family protein [Sphaerochaetaceae bacterium]
MNPFSVTVERKVEFFDVDPMRVVWNGRYFDYFECARSALLDALSIPYETLAEGGLMLYVVRNEAKYIHPVRLHDTILIKAVLREWEYLIRIAYEVRDKQTGLLCTKGMSEQMPARISDGKALMQLPEPYRLSITKRLEDKA